MTVPTLALVVTATLTCANVPLSRPPINLAESKMQTYCIASLAKHMVDTCEARKKACEKKLMVKPRPPTPPIKIDRGDNIPGWLIFAGGLATGAAAAAMAAIALGSMK